MPELKRSKVPKAEDHGQIIELEGTVIRAGAPKVLEAKKDYICTGCGGHFLMDTDEAQFYQHPEGKT